MEQPSSACRSLEDALSSAGILASTQPTDNYRRIWARDAVIAGLAGVLCEDHKIIDALRRSLTTLAAAQHELGMIPSNIDPLSGDRSYGGLAGRCDSGLWWIIGRAACALYDRLPLDEPALGVISKILHLCRCWEFNGRGLMSVPPGADWADAYVLHGYVLHVQLLRIWALRLLKAAGYTARENSYSLDLSTIVANNYWPSSSTDAIHPFALDRATAGLGSRAFWLPAFSPLGYRLEFDFFSNALALLLKLGDSDKQSAVIAAGEAIRIEIGQRLVPGFWPPIDQSMSVWAELAQNHQLGFKNQPGCYHNGGLWPMVSGWWGLALYSHGRHREANEVLSGIRAFNQRSEDADPGFYEWGAAKNGQPGGVRFCTWSMAAEIALEAGLRGATLFGLE